MSYNAKNYTEQGGDVTHIGGKIVYDNGLIPNMSTEAVNSDTVAKVRSTLNSLITQMKNAGLMVCDAFAVSVANSVVDETVANANRTYNTSKISAVAISDNVITITLSDKVANLKDFDGGNGWGVYKWLGIAISAGISPITDLYFNGTQLTNDDVTEATAVGLSAGSFVLWVKADRVVQGQSNTFKLWADGYEDTTFTLKIVEPTA